MNEPNLKRTTAQNAADARDNADEHSMFEAGERPSAAQVGYDAGYALRGTIGNCPCGISELYDALAWRKGYRLGVSHRQHDDARAAEQVSS